MSCPSRTNGSSRWTQLSPSFKTESPSQNETPPAGTSSQNEAQSALQKSVMDNQTMRQAITKAKQELKNIRQQIADEKSSAQPCNCDYDQLLNNIVHEPVDVNRHRLLSTAKTMSHAAATSTHRHTTTEPQTGRDSGPASPCLNTKPTTTPSQPGHRITAHFCARNCGNSSRLTGPKPQPQPLVCPKHRDPWLTPVKTPSRP